MSIKHNCLGQDLAFFLATLGAVQAGDGNHYSIGGLPGKTLAFGVETPGR